MSERLDKFMAEAVKMRLFCRLPDEVPDELQSLKKRPCAHAAGCLRAEGCRTFWALHKEWKNGRNT